MSSPTHPSSSKERCTAPKTGPGSVGHAISTALQIKETSAAYNAWLRTQDRLTEDADTKKDMYSILKTDLENPTEVTEMSKCDTLEEAKHHLKRYADIPTDEGMVVRMAEDEMGFEVLGDDGVVLMRMWIEKEGEGGKKGGEEGKKKVGG
jgi:hypothetical protein